MNKRKKASNLNNFMLYVNKIEKGEANENFWWGVQPQFDDKHSPFEPNLPKKRTFLENTKLTLTVGARMNYVGGGGAPHQKFSIASPLLQANHWGCGTPYGYAPAVESVQRKDL